MGPFTDIILDCAKKENIKFHSKSCKNFHEDIKSRKLALLEQSTLILNSLQGLSVKGFFLIANVGWNSSTSAWEEMGFVGLCQYRLAGLRPKDWCSVTLYKISMLHTYYIKESLNMQYWGKISGFSTPSQTVPTIMFLDIILTFVLLVPLLFSLDTLKTDVKVNLNVWSSGNNVIYYPRQPVCPVLSSGDGFSISRMSACCKPCFTNNMRDLSALC